MPIPTDFPEQQDGSGDDVEENDIYDSSWPLDETEIAYLEEMLNLSRDANGTDFMSEDDLAKLDELEDKLT